MKKVKDVDLDKDILNKYVEKNTEFLLAQLQQCINSSVDKISFSKVSGMLDKLNQSDVVLLADNYTAIVSSVGIFFNYNNDKNEIWFVKNLI